MKWQAVAPAIPGWYWLRDPSNSSAEWTIVHVQRCSGCGKEECETMLYFNLGHAEWLHCDEAVKQGGEFSDTSLPAPDA